MVGSIFYFPGFVFLHVDGKHGSVRPGGMTWVIAELLPFFHFLEGTIFSLNPGLFLME